MCENASCAPGLVIVAVEPDSVPAAAHLASYLQLPGLAACKTLDAHACIQAFRRRCARFFERASRAGRALGAKDGPDWAGRCERKSKRRAGQGRALGAKEAFRRRCVCFLNERARLGRVLGATSQFNKEEQQRLSSQDSNLRNTCRARFTS